MRKTWDLASLPNVIKLSDWGFEVGSLTAQPHLYIYSFNYVVYAHYYYSIQVIVNTYTYACLQFFFETGWTWTFSSHVSNFWMLRLRCPHTSSCSRLLLVKVWCVYVCVCVMTFFHHWLPAAIFLCDGPNSKYIIIVKYNNIFLYRSAIKNGTLSYME